jgi:hypothetical protein
MKTKTKVCASLLVLDTIYIALLFRYGNSWYGYEAGIGQFLLAFVVAAVVLYKLLSDSIWPPLS